MKEPHLNEAEQEKVNELQRYMSETKDENELKKVITEITLIRERAFARQYNKTKN